MKQLLTAATALFAFPAAAQEAEPKGAPPPNQIVAEAAAEEWLAIAPDDILTMTLAPDRDGNAEEVVIQLMPPPFSQGWIENIRTLTRAGWYNGVSINRVQDNYVVQWGDPNAGNPEADGAVKPLPEGLRIVSENDYLTSYDGNDIIEQLAKADAATEAAQRAADNVYSLEDPYAPGVGFYEGWPLAVYAKIAHPIHCYGMVGVGRSYSPDTGSGAELYTVIGNAPRHLDRNIALVGRVIEGIEHLSSLPRGKGDLGFYVDPDMRVPIRSVVLGSDMGAAPRFEYLSTESETFARYTEARANRRDPFFIVPAGGADICNIPVPVRRVSSRIHSPSE